MAQDGVDVAVLPAGQTRHVNLDEAEVAAPVAQLETIKSALVIVESTGGSQVLLVPALAAAAAPVAVVNPQGVRDFTKSTGQFAKTDRPDALILPYSSESAHPCGRQRTPILRRRRLYPRADDRVSAMLTAEKNHLRRAAPEVGRRIQEHIAWLEQEIDDPDPGPRHQVHQISVWRERDNRLGSVPGMGPQVSLTLSAHPPALGSLSQKQTAVPGRIASFTRGSGPHQGRQTVRGGRAVAGAALYMGALAASRANRGLRDFYQRLLAAGNPKQLVLTACCCNSLRS